MTSRQQQLLSLRLKMNAGRRENARSAKDEMERSAGRTERPSSSRHVKQQQHSGEAAADGGSEGRATQREERLDAAIAPLLHEPVDVADSRWKERTTKARRRQGYASEELDEEEERREGEQQQAGRRKARELSSHNVFDPQTAHRQYERNLMHAQQQQRVHQHKQHSAPESSAATSASSLSLPSATADPYTGRATPSATAVDRLVADMDAAAKRRAAFSRRRRHNDAEDVSYINESNKSFNKKVARAFDAYTIDIAQSLERGTAL